MKLFEVKHTNAANESSLIVAEDLITVAKAYAQAKSIELIQDKVIVLMPKDGILNS